MMQSRIGVSVLLLLLASPGHSARADGPNGSSVTGQGNYENPDASRRLSGILSQKGIPHELDLWGYDMPHDWPTWREMMRYYLEAKF